jgi:TPR repeat protein
MNMAKGFMAAAAAILVFSAPARAGETVETADGTLNPQELTLQYYAGKTAEPQFDQKMCVFGYPAAKMGDHVLAMKIFERCSSEGLLAAMPWAAWEEENGYLPGTSPEKAAEYDRRSADAGYSIGQLNYGLDLLRGRGVKRDDVLGRNFVDRAARQGDPNAQELAAAGYDPEAITPDADKERYRKHMY